MGGVIDGVTSNNHKTKNSKEDIAQTLTRPIDFTCYTGRISHEKAD